MPISDDAAKFRGDWPRHSYIKHQNKKVKK